jgi:hypothetical protein
MKEAAAGVKRTWEKLTVATVNVIVPAAGRQAPVGQREALKTRLKAQSRQHKHWPRWPAVTMGALAVIMMLGSTADAPGAWCFPFLAYPTQAPDPRPLHGGE